MVLTSSEIQDHLDKILLTVEKPGRYVGGELNQIVKPWQSVKTHVALIFPDIYDLGLPNLGLAILYDTLNQRADTLAERAYAPWIDMEDVMRKMGIPLYSLESKQPVINFDIIGFSLPYETLYTNTLNLLDLAGIPLLAIDRSKDHPLIIAGGHSAYNPEPMSSFVDAFVIGEGEEVIHEIVTVHQAWKTSDGSRTDLLLRLAHIEGIYIPSLYAPEYHSDGSIKEIIPLAEDAGLPIHKRIVPVLPPPPTHLIVPSINVVHNRISIEIMRGCTRGCRFCHAGMINRPVRERPVDEIVHSLEEALNNTGFEEIALLSLSSSDYTHILELVEKVSQQMGEQRLTIALPSLRIESFSLDLMEKLRGSRQGSFTLAPEAATDRMREIINKPIPTQQLLDTARAIYSRGWTTIKLYFMIGHPSETLEDVHAIADLCKAVINQGRQTIGRRANLHVGVSTFVPKAHTPFQWVACDTTEQIAAKQSLLRQELRGPGLKLNWTDPRETMLEVWLSRGDRRMSGIILRAWQLGAKFDAWQDQFNDRIWQQAFQENNLDPAFYTHRQRSLDEIFPWDHIHPGVNKNFILQDYQMSLQSELRSDCREQCYACGILPTYNNLRRGTAEDAWGCPPVRSKNIETSTPVEM